MLKAKSELSRLMYPCGAALILSNGRVERQHMDLRSAVEAAIERDSKLSCCRYVDRKSLTLRIIDTLLCLRHSLCGNLLRSFARVIA